MIARSQRQQLVRLAQKWLGTPYDDTHDDDAWKNLHTKPTTFDCSSFVCRVAMEVVGFWPGQLLADSGWLLDNLVEVESPQLGDVVGYGRPAVGEERETYNVVWHVMLYCGSGRVIGACDLAGAVTVRPMDYEPSWGDRQWRLAEPPPFRALAL